MNRSRLRVPAIACFILTVTAALSAASYQPLAEPYVGEVTGDNVYVRCGDKPDYYAVMRLNTGAKVMVLGRSGSWLAIAPPDGVFSMISKLHVSVEGEIGAVTGDDVRVRAGSLEFPSLYSTQQTQLSKGAKVRIIGQTEEYFKIVPPEGVVVYISSAYVKKVEAPATPTEQPKPAETAGSPEETASEAPGDAPAETGVETPEATETPAESPKPEPTREELIKRGIEAFEKAEAQLMAEYKKPEAKRDLEAMVKLYRSLDGSVDEALAARIDYRIRYLELAIQRRQGARQVEDISRRFKDQMNRLDSMIASLASNDAARLTRDMTLIGRLKASSIYTGVGAMPRRWMLMDDLTSERMAYVEAAGDNVNLAGNLNWKVTVVGRPKYIRELQEYVLVAHTVKKMPDGDPDKAPAPKPATLPQPIELPGPRAWDTPDAAKAPRVIEKAPVAPASAATVSEASAVLNEAGKPEKLPTAETSAKPTATTGLEMVPGTEAPKTDVNPEEFK